MTCNQSLIPNSETIDEVNLQGSEPTSQSTPKASVHGSLKSCRCGTLAQLSTTASKAQLSSIPYRTKMKATTALLLVGGAVSAIATADSSRPRGVGPECMSFPNLSLRYELQALFPKLKKRTFSLLQAAISCMFEDAS